MAVGAASGWVMLWRRLDGWEPSVAKQALRGLVLAAALLPPGVGLASQIAMIGQAPGPALEGRRAFRGACYDIPGFFASNKLDPAAVEARCSALSTASRQSDCLAGAAWGVGFGAARLEASKQPYPSARPTPDGRLCERVPPDMRGRCLGWNPGTQPGLGEELLTSCRSLPEDRRAGCFLGAGWFASQIAWGRPEWPLEACESLTEPSDRDACWGGSGFQAADHLGNTPLRLRALLQRVPVARQEAAARGAGLLLGRTWASASVANGTCDTLGGPLRDGCLGGVAEGRLHSVEP